MTEDELLELASACGSRGAFAIFTRAALARFADVLRAQIVVTKNEAGQIVAVTRQDSEGRILEVIAESTSGVAPSDRVQRLMDACEGELGGLALSRAAARRILAFVDGGTPALIAEAAKLGEEDADGVEGRTP